MRFRRLFCLVVSAGLLLSAAWADEVVMKNGDRVTGTIVKQDGKTITVKTDSFGVVTAPWDKVASIKSDQPVNVVLKDGKTLLGTVAPILFAAPAWAQTAPAPAADDQCLF